MGHLEKTVFISYRRTNASWALAVFQALSHHGYDVFLDYRAIASGDFSQIIVANIRARAHFVILLTPSALERCNEPTDSLRLEIESALDNQRNIVPLMLEGFNFETPVISSQLTGKLALLKKYNALQVPVAYFAEAMQRLREQFLNVPLEAVLHPASSVAHQYAKDRQTEAITAPPVQARELTAEDWSERAADALSKSEFDQAIYLYSEAIRLAPGKSTCFVNRGYARLKKDDLAGAFRDYEEAIRLEPNSAIAFGNRGFLKQIKGDHASALQDYNMAIRVDPTHPIGFNNRGLMRRKKGDLEGALQDYNEAIRLDPQAVTFFNRGSIRYTKGDLEGALRDYNEAIRIQPAALAFNGRGVLLRKKGDLEGALQDYNEALRLDPNNEAANQNRAEVIGKLRTRRFLKGLFS